MFWFEVKASDIKNTKIVAIDLHWFYSLYPVLKLCKKYKQINPEIKIILGGYTATIFANLLIKKIDCDYIIVGDADYSFPKIVSSILHNLNCDNIPNVVSKTFSTPFTYSLSSEDFNSCDYVNIDWFPSFKKRRQRYPLFGSNIFVQAIKGCFNNCEGCYGNQRLQRILSNRSLIKRDARIIADEITKYSQDKMVKTVFIDSDFISIFNQSELQSFFSRRYDLNLYYRFWNFCGDASIYDSLSRSFSKVRIYLPIYESHNGARRNVDLIKLERLLESIKTLPNIHITLLVNKEIKTEEKEFLKKTMKYYTNIYLRADYDIVIKVPMSKDSTIELDRYFKISKKRYLNIFFHAMNFIYMTKENKMMLFLLSRVYYCLHKKIIFNPFFNRINEILLFC